MVAAPICALACWATGPWLMSAGKPLHVQICGQPTNRFMLVPQPKWLMQRICDRDILGDLVTGRFFWYGLPGLFLTCKKWKTKTITHQLASIKWDALTPPTRIAETWSLAITSQKTTVFYKITWLDGPKTRKKTFSGEPRPPPFSRGKRIIDDLTLLGNFHIFHQPEISLCWDTLW